MATVRVGASYATYATLAGQRVGYRAASRAPWTEISELLLTWFERARERRQLGQLSDHMLKDIGLSRADVESEMSKRFWQP
jgi:uncharacterized protein YjiS (DUF1127 family)